MIVHMTGGGVHVEIAHIALGIDRIAGLCLFCIVETLARETEEHDTCRTIRSAV